MIELMCGIIMILILVIGADLYLTVADAHSGTLAVVRRSAGFVAMQPLTTLDTPSYIRNWRAGTDGQRFTADDQSTTTSPGALQTIAGRTVANNNQWQPFSNLRNTSSLQSLGQSPVPLMSLGFVGIRHSVDVEVPQFAQDLFYPDATVTVREDSWIPIMNGLY
jgi:hypothetical protein